MFVKFELNKGLKGVTKLCQVKRLFDHLLNLVHLE